LLLRAYRSLPKNKALIKFLSEEGIRQLLQKRRTNTWQITIAKCIRLMKHCILIEENNQVELTDHGIKFLSGDTDSDFFILPDMELKLPLSKRKIRKRR
jgi:preprotein translocase subunit SecA